MKNITFLGREKNSKGITLIALVITIIVLLILAGVSIATLTGENGILGKATTAKEETEEATAREILALTLLGAGQEKHTNSDYNEKEWLNSYIKNQNKEQEIDIKGDVVSVNGWEFEIDRNIPAIKGTVGQSGKDSSIQITLKQAINVEKKILKIEITANKEITSIKVNEELVDAKSQNGKYVVEKEVEGGHYEVTATDRDNKWNTASIDITDEIPIYDKEDMETFRDLVNDGGKTFAGKTVVLKNDIDLEGTEDNQWEPIGTSTTAFEGNLDGNNKAIRGLYMNRNDMNNLGLFGRGVKGEIKKLKIEDCYINSSWNNSAYGAIGGIAISCLGVIKQCSITGNLSFNYGEDISLGAEIISIGGIVANVYEGGSIEECYNGANILISTKKSTSSADQVRAGGITAYSQNGKVKDCYNSGNITTITTSTQTKNRKGGIVACVENGSTLNKIDNCYNMGTINANGDIGAILGTKATGITSVNNCYYLNTCGGSNANGGIALTQNQMQTPTFANVLNKTEIYSNTLDWTSKFKEGNELLWSYRENRPILKWQIN